MNDLDYYNDDELRAELERRQRLRAVPPELVLDWSEVQKTVEGYIRAIAKDGYADEDYKHYIYYIYEGAFEAVYGKAIWAWLKEARA